MRIKVRSHAVRRDIANDEGVANIDPRFLLCGRELLLREEKCLSRRWAESRQRLLLRFENARRRGEGEQRDDGDFLHQKM